MIIKDEQELQNKTMEEIHEYFNLDPINVRLYIRLENLWSKIKRKEPWLFEKTINLNPNVRDNAWWPRATTKINQGLKNCMYT